MAEGRLMFRKERYGMKKKVPIKTVYYKDELQDEFSTAVITPKKIDGSYVYLRESVAGKTARFFIYRLLAFPLAFCYLHLSFHHRTINRKVLKEYNGSFFLYGNHTQPIADALIPSFLHPKGISVIVHPNNVSMPVLGRMTPYIGALPLPDDLSAMRHFKEAIEHQVQKGVPVCIYPEAHIWPYYTGIRPFKEDSFYYPVKYGVPAFCFTNVYKACRFRSRPKIRTYIDGPFYPDNSLPLREQKKELRDRIHACMCQRAAQSDLSYIEYKKEENE